MAGEGEVRGDYVGVVSCVVFSGEAVDEEFVVGEDGGRGALGVEGLVVFFSLVDDGWRGAGVVACDFDFGPGSAGYKVVHFHV